MIVYGGTVNSSGPGSSIITSLGLKVETGGAEINDSLSVGKQLVVNNNGNNYASTSKIFGGNAVGGTTEGGTGLVISLWLVMTSRMWSW